MMDRREFLAAVTLSLLVAPLAAAAQQAGRVSRVGLLLLGDPSSPILVRATEVFRQGLREYGGYVEGRNIAIEYRYGVSTLT